MAKQSAVFRFNHGQTVGHVAVPGARFYISERAIIETPQAVVKKYIVKQVFGPEDDGGPGISAQVMEFQEHEIVLIR